ncbi:MAG: ORF6N domain-containing protein [Desulfobacterales bacterium]|jgi:hypothetical protein
MAEYKIYFKRSAVRDLDAISKKDLRRIINRIDLFKKDPRPPGCEKLSGLAKLYGVETKVFKQAVKRNINRFPEDVMFELTGDEFKNLRSQFVTSSWGGSRYIPMAFTEQGVAMLSSVLKSDKAVQVNIQIMRAFIKMRQMYISHEDLKQKIIAMERKYDKQFQIVFEAINQLWIEDEKPKRKIGYIKAPKTFPGKNKKTMSSN